MIPKVTKRHCRSPSTEHITYLLEASKVRELNESEATELYMALTASSSPMEPEAMRAALKQLSTTTIAVANVPSSPLPSASITDYGGDGEPEAKVQD